MKFYPYKKEVGGGGGGADNDLAMLKWGTKNFGSLTRELEVLSIMKGVVGGWGGGGAAQKVSIL